MTGTTRAGLLFGSLAFFSNLGVGMLALYICAPFLGVIWGVAAGIACISWSEHDVSGRAAAAIGAKAGAIAGVAAFLGLAVGMTIWFSLMGGQEMSVDLARLVAESQGIESFTQEDIGFLARYNLVGTTCCLGTMSIGVLSSCAAIGAYFYSSSTNLTG